MDDAVTIWSEAAGDPADPLIVLIHGTMDRSAGMLRLSRRLDDRFRVVRYDRRGYGRSAVDPAIELSYAMDAQVGDLLAVLDGRRAVLVGHSFGGNVALACAARAPELVAAVAVYESPLSWEPWWPGTTAGAQARAIADDPAEAAERFMRRLVGDGVWEALPERTRAARRAEGRALVEELQDLQALQPWRPEQIARPVVIAHGSDGADHHVRGMSTVHAWIAGSQLFVLDGCRHDAPNSHSALFADVVVGAAARAAGDPWASALNR